VSPATLEALERVVAEAPPLTLAQRDVLTTLLRTGQTTGGRAA